MLDAVPIFTLAIFLLTVVFLMWRPMGINEAYPTTAAAVILVVTGIVSFRDLGDIAGIVSGAAITILSTIVMSLVLDSIGLFRWTAYNIAMKARGSGIALYYYVVLLCFLMTLFFNNDGSILITTPIILHTLSILRLKKHQKIPYLIAGALVATASSAPIGVSNLANLIALNIVGLDLNTYAAYMFVPSMIGIVAITLLLYVYFYKDIPKRIPNPAMDRLSLPPLYGNKPGKPDHPLSGNASAEDPPDWKLVKLCLGVVVLVRAGFFGGASLGIPMEAIAIGGALLLIGIRWYYMGSGVSDLVRKTPWSIILFAFSIYVVVYALKNIGLTAALVEYTRDYVSISHFHAIMSMGLLLTVMSNLFNNLPSVMLGTLSITEMGLDTPTMQVAYLANIIGSDIGSLITPMGTLASLIWLYLLRKNKIDLPWKQYLKVTLMVIPIGLLISLLSLYYWTRLWF